MRIDSANGDSSADLLILDDIFPLNFSGFRLAEFRNYLEYFKGAFVYSTGESISSLNEKRQLTEVIQEFESNYPHLKRRTFPYTKKLPATKATYFVFLSNYASFSECIERLAAPFIFTLYPGGQCLLYDKLCNQTLRDCFSNPLFRKVIVTQPIVQEYLLEQKMIAAEQIVFIPGVVVPDEFLQDNVGDKLLFGQNKDTIDIAFIAHKYTTIGEDKGYDVFIKVAHYLAKHRAKLRFHVIGDFDGSVIDVSQLGDRIVFYGALPTAVLAQSLKGIDMIISPNFSGSIVSGRFDGFPTGSATQAGLKGVAVFCTDMLMQNRSFVDGKDLVLIPYDAKQIAECISTYLENMDKLYELALTGKETFRALYGHAAQIRPRLNLLEDLVNSQSGATIRCKAAV
jgi:glycosyltransferase involved in cell wall biosynthesis